MKYLNKGLNEASKLAPTVFDLFSEPINTLFNMKEREPGTFRTDLRDEGGQYRLTCDLPGVRKEDIKLSINEGVVTISCETRTEEEKQEEGHYLIRERGYSSMSRSFELPDVDENKVDAQFREGVLEVTFGKQTEPQNRRMIEIK